MGSLELVLGPSLSYHRAFLHLYSCTPASSVRLLGGLTHKGGISLDAGPCSLLCPHTWNTAVCCSLLGILLQASLASSPRLPGKQLDSFLTGF